MTKALKFVIAAGMPVSSIILWAQTQKPTSGPFDASRIEMHALIERLWREHRFTALLVTHDVQEAVALGERIVLIEAGKISFDAAINLPDPVRSALVPFDIQPRTYQTEILEKLDSERRRYDRHRLQ